MSKIADTASATTFQELLDQARSGSKEALGLLLEHLRRVLLHRAASCLDPDLRPKGAPSDLVQETFLEAQRDLESFRGASEEEFLAWVCSILIHNLENFRRRFRTAGKRQVNREVPLHAVEHSPKVRPRARYGTRTPLELVLDTEEVDLLQNAAEELPLVYRHVFHLHREKRWSFSQIGETLHCSADAARKLWQRALKKLAWQLRPKSE